jgi:hypothetical protein
MCSSSVSSLAKSGRVSVVALVVALLETQHVPHLRMRLHAVCTHGTYAGLLVVRWNLEPSGPCSARRGAPGALQPGGSSFGVS